MIDPDQATEALKLWCDRRGIKQGTKEFLGYLADRNGLYLLPAVKRRLDNQKRKKVQNHTMQVATGQLLDDTQRSQLADAKQPKNMAVSVDESLIAGLRVSFGNRRVHGSLKDRLTNLHTTLTA